MRPDRSEQLAVAVFLAGLVAIFLMAYFRWGAH